MAVRSGVPSGAVAPDGSSTMTCVSARSSDIGSSRTPGCQCSHRAAVTCGEGVAGAERLRADEVGGDVLVAEAEPRRLHAVGRQLVLDGEGLALATPAALLADAVAEGVHDGVEVGAHAQAVHPDVVAGVADDGDLGVGPVGLQAAQEAGAADAAGEDRDAHPVILSDGGPRPTPVIAASPGFGGAGVAEWRHGRRGRVRRAAGRTAGARDRRDRGAAGRGRPGRRAGARGRRAGAGRRRAGGRAEPVAEPEPVVRAGARCRRRSPTAPPWSPRTPPRAAADAGRGSPSGSCWAWWSPLVAGGLWYVSGLIGAGARVPQPDAGFAMTIDAVDGDRVEYSGVAPGWARPGPDGHRLRRGRLRADRRSAR